MMEIWIDYTNYGGERAWRQVIPVMLWFGTTEWHPEPQWLVDARDIGKANAMRTFALLGIHGSSLTGPPQTTPEQRS